MDFDQKLKNYAELIVRHGLNVQPDQRVVLSMEVIHRDLGLLIAEQAYRAGAKHVTLDLSDPRLQRTQIDLSSSENLNYVPAEFPVRYQDLLDQGGANLKILGSEYPDILEDADTEAVNQIRTVRYQALKPYYQEGIGKSKVHWNLVAAATPAWAKKVFPDYEAEKACEALWEDIFRVCRVDQPDFLACWKEHNAKLHDRARKLNENKIKTIRFKGPGTDLEVGLSERALFKGGSDIGPHGVDFEPNMPTEEVFTTPDWRKTSGKVRATRPVMINGVLVEGLELEFAAGELVNFEAKRGKSTFETYISSDEGAKRLGEVAFVGVDSPIFTGGLVYQEILFDENAACHIAVGSAYKFCIEGQNELTKDDFDQIGCNESSVHTDIMISSDEVDVHVETYSGEKFLLLKNGAWT